MKKFVSSGHSSFLYSIVIFCNILFIALLCLFIFKDGNSNTRAFAIISILTVILLTDLSAFRASQCGLYIDDENLYIQGFFVKKKVDLNDIIAVKIIPSAYHSKFGTRLIKDNHSNQLYSAVFMNQMIPDIQNYNNDVDLSSSWHNDRIMFKTIYDKEAIDYILTLNPNIKIL